MARKRNKVPILNVPADPVGPTVAPPVAVEVPTLNVAADPLTE